MSAKPVSKKKQSKQPKSLAYFVTLTTIVPLLIIWMLYASRNGDNNGWDALSSYILYLYGSVIIAIITGIAGAIYTFKNRLKKRYYFVALSVPILVALVVAFGTIGSSIEQAVHANTPGYKRAIANADICTYFMDFNSKYPFSLTNSQLSYSDSSDNAYMPNIVATLPIDSASLEKTRAALSSYATSVYPKGDCDGYSSGLFDEYEDMTVTQAAHLQAEYKIAQKFDVDMSNFETLYYQALDQSQQ